MAVEGIPDAAVIPAGVDVDVHHVQRSGSLSFTCWYPAVAAFPTPAACCPI